MSTRAAVVRGVTSPSPRGEEGGAAHVEVGPETGRAVRDPDRRSHEPVQKREAEDQSRGPEREEAQERKRPVHAQECLTGMAAQGALCQGRPRVPRRAVEGARQAAPARHTARQHDRLERLPENDRDEEDAEHAAQELHCRDSVGRARRSRALSACPGSGVRAGTAPQSAAHRTAAARYRRSPGVSCEIAFACPPVRCGEIQRCAETRPPSDHLAGLGWARDVGSLRRIEGKNRFTPEQLSEWQKHYQIPAQ